MLKSSYLISHHSSSNTEKNMLLVFKSVNLHFQIIDKSFKSSFDLTGIIERDELVLFSPGIQVTLPEDCLPDDMTKLEIQCSTKAFCSHIHEECNKTEQFIRNSISFEYMQLMKFSKFIHLRLEHKYIGKECYKIKVYKCSHRQADDFEELEKQDEFCEDSDDDHFIVDKNWIHIYTKFLTTFSCIAPNNYSKTSSKIGLIAYASPKEIQKMHVEVFAYDQTQASKDILQVCSDTICILTVHM